MLEQLKMKKEKYFHNGGRVLNSTVMDISQKQEKSTRYIGSY